MRKVAVAEEQGNIAVVQTCVYAAEWCTCQMFFENIVNAGKTFQREVKLVWA